LVKNLRRNGWSWLQRRQEASRCHAVGEADDEEEEEEQDRSRGWPRAAAATAHVGLSEGSEGGRVECSR